jgi:UDP-glucose 4-epimerase
MKKILITGVAGFIGSNLTRKLLDSNYGVIGVDNLSHGFKHNINEFLNCKDFEFYKMDVRDFQRLKKICSNVSSIIHLAAFKIPRYGNVMETLQINSKGLENVLNIAKNIENCKVIFISSSEVYGKNPEIPFKENSAFIIGESQIKRWSYAASKIFNEHLCYAYIEKYQIPITILRLFGGYGPKQNLTWWGGPQSVFINAALTGKPFPIHGDGKQTRTFTYISDIVEGIFLAFESKKADGEAFNIGHTGEISILDLANKIWAISGEKGKPTIKFIPYSSFKGSYEEVRRRIPDIEKARKILGFDPNTNLDEGLRKTIKWQKKIYKILAQEVVAK